jgi:hypothetical protein
MPPHPKAKCGGLVYGQNVIDSFYKITGAQNEMQKK